MMNHSSLSIIMVMIQLPCSNCTHSVLCKTISSVSLPLVLTRSLPLSTSPSSTTLITHNLSPAAATPNHHHLLVRLSTSTKCYSIRVVPDVDLHWIPALITNTNIILITPSTLIMYNYALDFDYKIMRGKVADFLKT
jgi:hypothetical protein